MTRWMAGNELKNTQFYEIDQLPKKSRFSFERSLLTPYSERSKVAKTNCHSARSKVESQNPKMKMVAGKEDLEGKISPDEETLTPLKNPSSPKN